VATGSKRKKWWAGDWTPLVKKELAAITGCWIYWPEMMENASHISHVDDNNYLMIIIRR
jgi:hypothetical protein